MLLEIPRNFLFANIFHLYSPTQSDSDPRPSCCELGEHVTTLVPLLSRDLNHIQGCPPHDAHPGLQPGYRPFLPAVRPHTFAVLEDLDVRGLTNPRCRTANQG